MLTREQNEALTRVGPGTPTGALLRRYWIPALLEWELPEPDCAPVRLTLLGERLVGFRDTSGRVGVMEEFCPHRGASLWLGRNEENGLRCVYHGWKFDVAGRCVDQMNEPQPFGPKVRLQAYPTVEEGGVVWVYMGPEEKQPPPPRFGWTQAPPENRCVTKVVEECNWLQALEGGIDTSHAPILHRALKDGNGQSGIPSTDPFVRGSAPTLEVDVTSYGYRYFGIRQLGENQQYVRGYHFVMPWTQLRPAGRGRARQTNGHHWVPIDDSHVMVWNWYYRYDGPLPDEERDPQYTGNSFTTDIDVNNGFRPYRNSSNDWGIDRRVQKTESFSGIRGINAQDRAVQEGMGPIVDRSREHLGPADKAIITMRKLMQEAVQTIQDGGDPPGATDDYYGLRAVDAVLPTKATWRETLLGDMDSLVDQRQA